MVNLKSRPSFVAVAVAAAMTAAGAAVVVQGVQTGAIALHGVRLMAFLVGVAICATGIYLFQRGARRRARFDAIRALLPRADDRRRAWSIAGRGMGPDAFLFDDSDLGDDPSQGMPLVRAEIREATRALLMSLEEEMRHESGRRRRSGRPACRRARLRAAGRSEPRRRRIQVRPVAIPS